MDLGFDVALFDKATKGNVVWQKKIDKLSFRVIKADDKEFSLVAESKSNMFKIDPIVYGRDENVIEILNCGINEIFKKAGFDRKQQYHVQYAIINEDTITHYEENSFLDLAYAKVKFKQFEEKIAAIHDYEKFCNNSICGTLEREHDDKKSLVSKLFTIIKEDGTKIEFFLRMCDQYLERVEDVQMSYEEYGVQVENIA